MSNEPPPPYSAQYPTADDMKKPYVHPSSDGGPSNQPILHQPTAPTSTTVIIQQSASFGPQGQATVCPNCAAQVVTSTEHTAGLLTWLVCVGCCIVGLDCGCCLIPFCVDDMQDVTHSCPNCNQFMGTYKRL